MQELKHLYMFTVFTFSLSCAKFAFSPLLGTGDPLLVKRTEWGSYMSRMCGFSDSTCEDNMKFVIPECPSVEAIKSFSCG